MSYGHRNTHVTPCRGGMVFGKQGWDNWKSLRKPDASFVQNEIWKEFEVLMGIRMIHYFLMLLEVLWVVH